MNARLPLVIALSAWASRAVSAGVQLLTIPILFGVLGKEHYAALLLLVSLAGWYQLADLGVGNALQNAFARQDSSSEELASLLKQCLRWLLLTSAAVFALALLASHLVAENLLKDFGLGSETTAAQLFVLASGIHLAAAIGGISYKIWYGEHRGWIANVCTIAGSILTLVAVRLVEHAQPHQQLALALIAYSGPPALIMAAGLAARLFRRPSPAPQTALAAREQPQRFRKVAGEFWLFALLAAVVLNVDHIVIAKVLTPDDMVTYSVTNRLFMVVMMVYASALQAFWPYCTRLLAAGEALKVRQVTIKLLVTGAVLVGVSSYVIWVARDMLFEFFTRSKEQSPASSLLLLFLVYFVVRVWCDTFAMLLHSQGRLRVLLMAVPVQGLLSAGCQIVFAKQFGLHGILLGLLASYLLTVAWMLPVAALRSLQTADASGKGEQGSRASAPVEAASVRLRHQR